MKTLVYLFIDPRTNRPYYVGIGSRYRASLMTRNAPTNAVTSEIRAAEKEPKVEIIGAFHDRPMAGKMERTLISVYGRRDIGTGSLTNLSDGGHGGQFNPGPETREKLRRSKLGNPSFTGRKHRPETIEKMRLAATGRKTSEATKRKIAAANLGKKAPLEVRLKMSAAGRGRKQKPEHVAKRMASGMETRRRKK